MYMWTQIVAILLSLMLGISVSYGQEKKTLTESKPVRFTQGGYQFTVQSALRDGQLETVVLFRPTAANSTIRAGEVRLLKGRRGAAITSRAGDDSTITLTQARSRLSAVFSRDGKTVRKEGNEAEVMRFVEDQDKADAKRRSKLYAHLGEITARDNRLGATLKKNILQTIEELKERQKDRWERLAEEWERRCREEPATLGCPNASLCSRAGDGCSGGCMVCCGVAAMCDAWVWYWED